MSLLNRAAIKRYAKEIVKRDRAGRFTRVSDEFVDRMEISLKAAIDSAIHRHPSVGKTLM